MRFQGKTAFITGGAIGLGRAFARALTGEGAEGLVYSIDMTAVYNEFGTSRNPRAAGERGNPPRPFLFPSMVRCEPHVTAIFGAFLTKALTFG